MTGGSPALNGPTFVAIDANRTIGSTTATWLYVSEHGNIDNTGGGRIFRYNLTSGSATPDIVAVPAGTFTSPDAILIDSATGDLTIADRAQNRVVHITNTGTVVSSFGSGQLHGPAALAMDSSGNIYVAEHGDTAGTIGNGGSYVSKWSGGTRVWHVGGIGNLNGQFANTGPYGLAVVGSTLYVTDGFSSRVQSFDLNGNYLGQFALTGALPLGVFADGSGALWIAEGTNSGDGSGAIQDVKKYSTAGAYGGVTLSGGLSLPFDVAINSATNLAYVADYNNDRIAIFNLAAPVGAVPAINSSASASGTVGQNFSYQVTATNSPSSYAAVDALPAGLVLNTSTGAITGIPSAAGTTTTHLTATNGSGTSTQFALTFTVAAASGSTPGTPALPLGPTVTHFDLNIPSVVQGVSADWDVTFSEAVTGVDAADFVVNTQGSATATVTGVSGSGTTYTVHMNYTDQNGSIQMAIKTSATGISGSSGAFRGAGHTASPVYGTGTTAAADTSRPQVTSVVAGTATGNNASFTVTFSEAVTGVDAADFIITDTSATIGTVTGTGTTYTVPITASGSGTVTLTVVGGASSNIRDAATNILGGAGSTSASVTIAGSSTGSAPTISNQTATGTQGTALSYQVAASGATSFSITSGTLPAGLTMSTAGVISGTPTAAGSATVTVQATNSTGSASAQVTVTINASTTGSAPTIANQTTTGTQSTALSYQIVATGATSYSISSGTLPAGLTLNTSTGVVSGTPTASGSTTVTVTATNANGSSNATLTFTIAAAGSAPTIANQTASGTVSAAFNYQVVATGATSYSITSGTLPAGLSLNTTTGVVSGTPTAAGSSTVTVRATNANGNTSATLTITIAAATGSAPAIANQSATGTQSSAFNYQITATGATSYSIVSGTLPAGLSLNTTTGVISGTPTATGTSTLTVRATNANGSTNATLTITINASTPPPPPPPQSQTVVITPPTSSILVGVPITISGTSTSGLPITYSVVTGDATISGNVLTINSAGAVVVKGTQSGNSSWAAASSQATFNAQKQNTLVTMLTAGGPVPAEKTVSLAATTSSGLSITYSVVSGPATVNGTTLTFTGTGPVVVRAATAGNGTYNAAETTLTLNAKPVDRLTNISSRLRVTGNEGGRAYIAGFVVTGTAPKQMLIRAVGPSLASFGISDGLSDPKLTLYNGSGAVIATNSGWSNDAQITAAGGAVSAFPLNAGSKDAALLVTLAPGTYTAQVQSSNNGTVLIEVYDVSANDAVPTKQLINISTRGYVGTGNDAMIGGFVVNGADPKKILVRAVGPTLASFGVSATLADPVLKIYDASGHVIAQNDNWSTAVSVSGSTQTAATGDQISAAGTSAGAFPLATGTADAAVLLTLPPGSYTAVVTGANGTTGAALVEVYEVPNP